MAAGDYNCDPGFVRVLAPNLLLELTAPCVGNFTFPPAGRLETWDQARARCRGLGLDLASVGSLAALEALDAARQRAQLDVAVWSDLRPFATWRGGGGGSDVRVWGNVGAGAAASSAFARPFGGAAAMPWAAGEPSVYNGVEREDCVEVRAGGGCAGCLPLLNDAECGAAAAAAACEDAAAPVCAPLLYAPPNDAARAMAYCRARCDELAGCVGLALSRRPGGSERCRLYSSALDGPSWEPASAAAGTGAVCRRSAPTPGAANHSNSPTPAPAPGATAGAHDWRIVVDSTVGGGGRVQLTEASFANGDRAPTQINLAPVTDPPMTTGNCPQAPGSTGAECMNNGNASCSEQNNLDGRPASYTYAFGKREAPRFVRLAQCDSNARMAKLITPQYRGPGGAWVSCAQIDTAQLASADDFQHRLHGSAAMHDVAFACPEPGGSFGGGDGGSGDGNGGNGSQGGSGGGSGGGAEGEGGCMSKAHGACACTEFAAAGLQLEKLLLVVLVGLPAVLLASRRARQLEQTHPGRSFVLCCLVLLAATMLNGAGLAALFRARVDVSACPVSARPPALHAAAFLFGTPLLGALQALLLWHCVHGARGAKPRGTREQPPGREQPAPPAPVRVAVMQGNPLSGGNPLTSQLATSGRRKHGSDAAPPASPAAAGSTAPTVWPADKPNTAYLARCTAASAALLAQLEAAPLPLQAAMAECLLKKCQLRWTGQPQRRASVVRTLRSAASTLSLVSLGHEAAAAKAEVDPGFLKAAKALHALALRYPGFPSVPLAQGPFVWDPPPFRAQGPAAVQLALGRWTDTEKSAAASTMFSSMGIWISPFAVPFLAVCSVILLLMSFSSGTMSPSKFDPAFLAGFATSGHFNTSSVFCGAVGMLLSCAALLQGRRLAAQVCYGVGCCAACVFATLNFTETLAKQANDLGNERVLNGDLYDTAAEKNTAVVVIAVTRFMVAPIFFSAMMLALKPWRTFAICFVCVPALLLLMQGDCFWLRKPLGEEGALALPCYFVALGVFVWMGRRDALVHARRLGVEDAARYEQLWARQLLPSPGFRDELSALRRAWNAVQKRATRLPKRQAVSSLFALLREADKLNDPLQAALHALCAAHRGEFHGSEVKTEGRALQKVFRSYRGDWGRLCDLCRASLVFETVADLCACLLAIGADAELEVVHAGDDKMRFREDFDAARKSGGYRDIQLCVRLNSAEARARGVHQHLAEVQLHLAPVIALKSDQGHANYVLRRNLNGQ